MSNFLVSINLFQNFQISNIFKWCIISLNCKYHCSCLNARFRVEIRERFHIFLCVLTINNENRMHAQKFVEENVLSSYEMTRYSRTSHVLIILSLRFKSELSNRISLQKSIQSSQSYSSSSSSSSISSSSSFSSSSSSSLSILQISVRSHDCRDRYEFHTFTNKSSRSRILSIDERKRNNELIALKRSWEKTKNNVTSVHRNQHLIQHQD